MATKAELAKVLDDAHDLLHKIEDLAVSERNRVADFIHSAQGAVASMPDPAPVAEAPQAVEAPQDPARVEEPQPDVVEPAA